MPGPDDAHTVRVRPLIARRHALLDHADTLMLMATHTVRRSARALGRDDGHAGERDVRRAVVATRPRGARVLEERGPLAEVRLRCETREPRPWRGSRVTRRSDDPQPLTARRPPPRGGAARRLQLTARLHEFRTQTDAVLRLIAEVREQTALAGEERACVTAEYRLLAENEVPLAWRHAALEHERRLLRDEIALGREWLRLVADLRRIRDERSAVLVEQATLLSEVTGWACSHECPGR